METSADVDADDAVTKDNDVDVTTGEAVSVAVSDLTTQQDQIQGEVAPPKEISHESIPAVHSYEIKPCLQDKFKGARVKDIITSVLMDTLTGQVYDSTNVKKWAIKISNEVNTKVRELRMKRYKHIVQVIMGELKGAGVKSGVRCLWDSETDGYASDIFMNDTIFCVTTVFAVYLY